jgi:hypothetical protein
MQLKVQCAYDIVNCRSIGPRHLQLFNAITFLRKDETEFHKNYTGNRYSRCV